jgi:hypothetical protein
VERARVKAKSAAMAILAAGAVASMLWAGRRRPLRRRVEPGGRRIVRNSTMAVIAGVTIAIFERPIVESSSRRVAAGRLGLVQRLPVSAAARNALAVVLMDYTLYWWHVLMHRWDALYRLHQVHHCDLELDASTALRSHFGEMLASAPWRAAQVALLGVSPRALRIWQRATIASVLFHHSNLRLQVVLARFVATPRLARGSGAHRRSRAQPAPMGRDFGSQLGERLVDLEREAVPEPVARRHVAPWRGQTPGERDGFHLALQLEAQRLGRSRLYALGVDRRQHDDSDALPVAHARRERVLPDAMRAGDHDRQDRHAQRLREPERTCLERGLDAQHRALRKEQYMLAGSERLGRARQQPAVGRGTLLGFDGDVPHAGERRTDPRPLEDFRARDESHGKSELRQAQGIGKALMQRHHDVWRARQMRETLDFEPHTEMREEPRGAFALQFGALAGLEIARRSCEAEQVRDQQPPAAEREAQARERAMRGEGNRRTANDGHIARMSRRAPTAQSLHAAPGRLTGPGVSSGQRRHRGFCAEGCGCSSRATHASAAARNAPAPGIHMMSPPSC